MFTQAALEPSELAQERPEDQVAECELSFKDHAALCEVTNNALRDLLTSDKYLCDIPYDASHEEIAAQIAVLRGQSITVVIERCDSPTLHVVVPQSNTTVLDLKKAIRRTFHVDQNRRRNRELLTPQSSKRRLDRERVNNISWRYIWRTYLLVLDIDGQPLLDDHQLLPNYGVEHKSVLRFVKRAKIFVYCRWCAIDLYADSLPDGNNNNIKLSEHGLQLTQTINIQRQEYLQKMCKIVGYENATLESSLTEQQMDHLLIDQSHKFLYCYVPKVACTNWKRVLMIMSGKWKNGTDPLLIPASLAHSTGIFQKFSSLNPDERKTVLSEYTRLIITRHPFERLLSAYRNKLEGNLTSAKYFQSRIGKIIVKSFRENPSNESLELGHDVTFEEFVKYLLTPNLSMNYQENQSFNEHWEPAAKLCHPCAIKYNVIGKYDSLLDDSALALYLSGVKNFSFPTGHRPSGTSSQLRTYFEPIPVGSIRKLYAIYEDDFRLFDYGLEDVLGFEFG